MKITITLPQQHGSESHRNNSLRILVFFFVYRVYKSLLILLLIKHQRENKPLEKFWGCKF